MAKDVVAPELARRLRARIKKRRISVAALAAAAGMKQQGLNEIVHGHVARPRRIREIARELGITQEWLLEGILPEDAPDAADPVFKVPLIDWVSAGRPEEIDFASQDASTLIFSGLGRGQFFATRVEGDSMDRVSPEGSIIVVNKTETTPINGKFYVFSLRGKPTYKVWHAEPPYLKPLSFNPAHDPILFKKRDLVVIGRVCLTAMDL